MTDTMIWVINASPIIVLAKVGYLDLLFSESRTAVVPLSVVDEISKGPPSDPARQILEANYFNTISVTPDPDVLQWGLGSGETEVISHARQVGAVAILDDRAARTAANVLGVRVMGTLGVVLLARRENRISDAVSVLMTIRRHGLRLSDEVIRTGLAKTTGETWPSPIKRK